MPDRAVLPLFVVLWSSGYVVGAVAVGDAGFVPLLAARFTLATLVAVPLALRHGRWRGAPLGRLAVVGLLLQVVQFVGVYAGLSLGVPAALSALVILGLAPVVTTGLAVLDGQERADVRLWGALAVGVAGVGISLGPELGSARVGAGIGLTLLGMLGLAGGTVLQKRWVGVADPRVSTAVQSVTGAVVLDAAFLAVGGRADVSVELGASVLWIAWVLGIAMVLLFVHLLRRHAASSVAALLLVVPAVTAIVSAPALGETLHPLSLAGMLVAMAGVGAVLRREAEGATRPGPRRRRPAAPLPASLAAPRCESAGGPSPG